MPLSKWQIKPGFDKQNSEVGAVARYVGGDNVRFRYTLPEKVGGWKAEGGESISSVSRRLHAFRGNDGNNSIPDVVKVPETERGPAFGVSTSAHTRDVLE